MFNCSVIELMITLSLQFCLSLIEESNVQATLQNRLRFKFFTGVIRDQSRRVADKWGPIKNYYYFFWSCAYHANTLTSKMLKYWGCSTLICAMVTIGVIHPKHTVLVYMSQLFLYMIITCLNLHCCEPAGIVGTLARFIVHILLHSNT